ncbi:lamin tail domain-containing protein [Parapedobacter luteus]|uniref:lamin tail domain-containing protein n=1 Tax=Parapedobacter luteus TaxID=623280 RepID=UPI0009A62260|nr:gliding motility-associated C-terminal domain-containing protein [Parapedobacter luteus]
MKNSLFSLSFLLPLLCGIQPLWIEQNVSRPPVHRETKLLPDDTIGASFFDDFSAGLLAHWLGHTTSFIPADNRLQLNPGAVAPAFIAIPSARLRNTAWEAGIQVDDVLTANNFIRLYLASTASSLNEPLQGYHLQIDGTDGTHTYRLWRQNGNTRTVIFQSKAIANRGNKFRARIRVTHSIDGQWQILADEYGNGTFNALYSEEGVASVTDATYPYGGYAGFFVNFSPTRAQDYRLDYLLIKPLDPPIDTIQSNGIQPGDILINEVLSNPKPAGVDFIEIYNHSNKTINLEHIEIASVNSSGTPGSRRKISEAPLAFYPNEYKVLTTNPHIIKQHYPHSNPNAFIETPMLPNFNNAQGGVVLYSGKTTIDSLFYTPALQSPFISNHQGISLERQYFSRPTNDPDNFRSAASLVGGATPGYQNSQQPVQEYTASIFLTSKTFSPDNDGFEDELEINYQFPDQGFMATVNIYNDKGVLVKRLQRNQSLANKGTITWDGLSDANQPLPVGIYIAVIETYNAHGARKVYRKSFVLAARL